MDTLMVDLLLLGWVALFVPLALLPLLGRAVDQADGTTDGLREVGTARGRSRWPSDFPARIRPVPSPRRAA